MAEGESSPFFEAGNNKKKCQIFRRYHANSFQISLLCFVVLPIMLKNCKIAKIQVLINVLCWSITDGGLNIIESLL